MGPSSVDPWDAGACKMISRRANSKKLKETIFFLIHSVEGEELVFGRKKETNSIFSISVFQHT